MSSIKRLGIRLISSGHVIDCLIDWTEEHRQLPSVSARRLGRQLPVICFESGGELQYGHSSLVSSDAGRHDKYFYTCSGKFHSGLVTREETSSTAASSRTYKLNHKYLFLPHVERVKSLACITEAHSQCNGKDCGCKCHY